MAKIFARVVDDRVIELITEVEDINKEWHGDFVASLVDVTTVRPAVHVGWLRSGKTFAPPAPYIPPPDRQMVAAVTAGCAIASTGTPALDATYDAAGPRWQLMKDEVLYVVSFGSFSGNPTPTEIVWPAKTGPVTFATTDQLKAVTRAIGDWLTGWQRYAGGQVEAPPAQPVTIP